MPIALKQKWKPKLELEFFTFLKKKLYVNELRKHKISIMGDFAFKELTFFKRMKVPEIGTILEFESILF